MRRSLSFLYLFLAIFAFASLASAQVTTDPVGFISTACLANSDTFLSLPFTRPPEFTGNIASTSGNVLTISGSPAWNNNQFAYTAGSQPNTYYALIGPNQSSSPNEGRAYQVTSNGSNTLTVNLNGDNLTAVQANTQVLVIPYWTFNTVFPASDANVSFIPSPNAIARQTQILIPNYSGSGINLSAAATYFYSSGVWHTTADPGGNRGDDPIVPDGYFTLRNAGTGTNLTSLGSVLVKKQTIPLLTSNSHQTDNFVSITRPIGVSLNSLGLISSGAFAPSPNAIARVDQLFVFNNAVSGLNKSAATTYFYSNSLWHTTADPAGDHGADLIAAGSGFIIRKGTTASGATQFWQNAPTY